MSDTVEVVNRCRVDTAKDKSARTYRMMVGAIKAEGIAEMLRALCPDGQDIKYDEAVEYYNRWEE